MTSSFKGQIPASSVLSKKARDTNVFKDLYRVSIISLEQLCDDGCTATLDKKLIRFVKGTRLVLSGKRNQMDGLWDIPLTSPVP